MSYNISKPSPLLLNLVKHYWTIDNCLLPDSECIQRIVPNGLMELIFYFGNVPESLDKDISIHENTIVAGQLSKYYDIRIKGTLSIFSVIFQPFGLAELLDIPLSELFNQNIPLKYLIKDITNELETKLFEANSFSERIKITEQFLTKRIYKSDKKYHLHRIKNCINTINNTKGIVSIDYLASEACFSRKQFERVFSDYIGTSPKQFMKTIRFQNAINEKFKNKNANLTTLTYLCGYYDQSHMINDFVKLSGMTPKKYFDGCEPYSDYFQ